MLTPEQRKLLSDPGFIEDWPPEYVAALKAALDEAEHFEGIRLLIRGAMRSTLFSILDMLEP